MEEIDKNDPNLWKCLGLFYYNPKDPEVLCKASNIKGIVTLNFGHRIAYLYLAILVALLLAIILVEAGVFNL